MNRNESDSNELILSTLERINARLDNIESQLFDKSRKVGESHPSLQKVPTIEAIADRIFLENGGVQACDFEPNDKPCDQCSMCNTRGF